MLGPLRVSSFQFALPALAFKNCSGGILHDLTSLVCNYCLIHVWLSMVVWVKFGLLHIRTWGSRPQKKRKGTVSLAAAKISFEILLFLRILRCCYSCACCAKRIPEGTSSARSVQLLLKSIVQSIHKVDHIGPGSLPQKHRAKASWDSTLVRGCPAHADVGELQIMPVSCQWSGAREVF